MENKRKVTIITPTYNAEKDIEACILSVANQTYQDKEHLIVDGLSTDGTLDIVRHYAEIYPHVKLVSEKDNGIYDAMNKGIDLATGDWLYFLGCDDVLYSEKVLEELFNSNEMDVFDFVYGNVIWGDTGRIYDGEFSLLKLMDKNICHQAIFYKHSIFNKIGKFDLEYRVWADYLLNIKCFNSDEVRTQYVDNIIAKYGTSGRSSAMEDSRFNSNREAIFRENFPEEYNVIKESLQGYLVELDQKGHQLAARDKHVADLDRKLFEKDYELERMQREIAVHQATIAALQNSLSWKITYPLRKIDGFLAAKLHELYKWYVRRRDKIDKLIKFTRALWVEHVRFVKNQRRLPGINEIRLLLNRSYELSTMPYSSVLDPYESWLEVNGWNRTRENLLVEELRSITNGPLISIVMPVYNPPVDLLRKAVQSLRTQLYDNWELCLADDASTDPEVRHVLHELAQQDGRIRVTCREQNGSISLATNSAAQLANGEYLLLMDQDDELSPDALAEVALYLQTNPQTDVLYSDDDKIDTGGRRFDPQFKPDWSPELLLNYMYFSHLFVVRRSLYWSVGGMRAGFEGSQDYDLALRVTEHTEQVGHIPRVLYHWRVVPGSTAASGDAKPASFEAGRRAVQEALDRRGISARVIQPDWAISAKCGIFAHAFPDTGPSVAIIIPTRNKVDVLEKCIQSIKAKTTYRNYTIVIVDNESDDPETIQYLGKLPDRVLRIESPGGRFNYAAINNRAVELAESDYVLFLNNDTEVLTPNWLSQMVGYLGIPGVGAVGAKLIFPDNRIQHAGIVHGYYNGMAGPAFKLLPSWHGGYLSYTKVARNYSAVTAACLLTHRTVFLELGGFDEKQFPVAYNDVDYCYRLREHGFRLVYCPTAELVHYENYSRGGSDNPAEVGAFRTKYRQWYDPYYNPNLSLDNEQFQVAGSTLVSRPLSPVRTLVCSHNLNLEGAPNSQYELTVFLKQQKVIEPIVFCPVDGPLRRMYEEAGVRVEIFTHPLQGVSGLSHYMAAIQTFAAKVKELGVELVYGNTLQTFYAIHAAAEAGLPSVWNPRESEPWQTYFDEFGPDISKKALECFKYPYKVVFVANSTRAGYAALNSRNNFATIHNGLNLDRLRASLELRSREEARRELDLTGDELVVLLLGTICERKGQLDLVEAVGCLVNSDVEKIKVFIVGDRPSEYSDTLKTLHQGLPEERKSSIEIIPETHDTALYYSAADIFVCTSRIESFPRVILEAMASGLPIITTPVFGIAEQVRENVNGLFYSPGDSKALAAALSRLINDDGLRADMAAKSRQVLATLNDFESMANAYGQLFREALLSGGPRACAE